jgi:hypothetical protein
MLRVGLLVLGVVAPLAAQEDFGFGFGDETEEAPSSSGGFSFISGARVSGEVSAQLLGYGDDFTSSFTIKDTTLGDVFSGKLNFSASGSNAEAVINLNLAPVFDGSASPVAIDEAYLRAYFGGFTIEGGLRKLTWGKADSLGPLDVVNPLDYSDLTNMTDIMGRKIARPLIHASYSLGSFSKLEGVFIPWFEGHRFANEGRWAPSQLTDLPDQMTAATGAYIIASAPPTIPSAMLPTILEGLPSDPPAFEYPKTDTLKYAQAGLRFTTTIGSSDIGVQYYFGRLPRPAVTLNGVKDFWKQMDFSNPMEPIYTGTITPTITYNWYHQIGLDYAQVIAGFNLRAELAGNITEDSAGDNGSVYNPSIAWSVGFDRDVVWGINLNLQATESIRLLNDQAGGNIALDTEAGTDMTTTRITGVLSKKLLRDELELKVTGIWGIEDKDFFILPAIIWTKGDVAVELSGGILGGDAAGELGQYHRNGFVKALVTYSF